MSSGLVLDWRCGEPGTGGDAGYKAGIRGVIGAHVVHLWDRRARLFYGYRAIGHTPHFRYDRTTEYQTLRAALLAAEQEMRFSGRLT
jgi:hypothetical protein